MPLPTFSPMVGTTVAVTVEFVDETGGAADPTTTTISVRDPSGAISTPEPEHQGVGIFRAEFPLTAAGVWTVQAKGVGVVAVVDEEQFTVRSNLIP